MESEEESEVEISDQSSELECSNVPEDDTTGGDTEDDDIQAVETKPSDQESEELEENEDELTEQETREQESTLSIQSKKSLGLFKHIIIPLVLMISFYIISQYQSRPQKKSMIIDFKPIEDIGKKHPEVLSHKKLRTIKNRVFVMEQEVSVLMLLGKFKDVQCRSDITYCLGQSIVNLTQPTTGYINAANPSLDSNELQSILKRSLVEERKGVMIDSLEKLPGFQVLNLFQFIDKDAKDTRTGMLVFTVYTGQIINQANTLKEADLAEMVLLDSWSSSMRRDSLSSVISRMCKSIVKLY